MEVEHVESVDFGSVGEGAPESTAEPGLKESFASVRERTESASQSSTSPSSVEGELTCSKEGTIADSCVARVRHEKSSPQRTLASASQVLQQPVLRVSGG